MHDRIRHTLIEPGYFRAELLNPNSNVTKASTDQQIPVYADMNERVQPLRSIMVRSQGVRLRG